MATYNNISVNPSTGQGGADLSVSALPHTGRLSRSARFTLSGTVNSQTVPSSNELVVTQSEYGESFSITPDSNTTAFPAAGGPLTYSGQCNLATLSLGTTGNLDACLQSATITVGSQDTTLTKAQLQAGYDVPNDPGASALYNVEFDFIIPQNETASSVPYSGTICGRSYSVNQLAAQQTLSFSRSTATVTAGGTSGDTVTVNAPSGMSWTIEAVQ